MDKMFKRILLGLCVFFLCATGFGQNLNQSIQAASELEKAGKTEEALWLFENLFTQYPENAIVFSRFRDFCMRTQEYDRVLELVKARRIVAPDDPGLDVTEAHVLFKQGNRERALKTWRDILNRYPAQIRVYQLTAEAMIQERLLDNAVEVYLLGRRRIKQKDLFALNLINLYTAQIEYGKATRELLLYYETHPKQTSLLENQLRRFPKTDKVVQEVTEPLILAIEKNPSDLRLRRILVMFYLYAERYDKSMKAALDLEAVTPKKKQGEMLFQAARLAFQAGSAQEAIPIYQTLLSHYPDFRIKDEARFGLAQCYETLGMIQEAIEVYHQTANISQNPSLAARALYRIGMLYQSQFNLQEAQKIYLNVIDAYPFTREYIYSRLALCECWIGLGDLEAAQQVIQEVLNEFPRHRRAQDPLWIKARIRMADLLYLKGAFQESLELLKETTGSHLKALSLQEPDLNNGLMLQIFLGEQLKKNPEPLKFLVRGEKWVRMHRWQDARSALDSLSVQWPNQPAAVHGLFRKGEVLIRMELYSHGLANFDTLIARYPSHLLADRALERTGWIYEQMKRKKKALERYEQLLVQYPQSFLADEIRGRIRRLEKEIS
jgi:tetratricopeptide (TPR) repeat protein